MSGIEKLFYDKWEEKREEAFELRLALIEVKIELNLAKLGYRTIDDAIKKIDDTLNK